MTCSFNFFIDLFDSVGNCQFVNGSDVGITFLSLPADRVVASRSRPLTLNCSVAVNDDADSAAISYRWSHNSLPIADDDSRFEFKDNGSVLVIRKLLASIRSRRRTDGTYTCFVTTRFGTIASKDVVIQSTSKHRQQLIAKIVIKCFKIAID